MRTAQGDEIGELGLAAVGPVLDVMCIEIVLVSAAGKAAAGIPSMQRAPDRGGNGAGLASDVE
jgi:hypothetical protein